MIIRIICKECKYENSINIKNYYYVKLSEKLTKIWEKYLKNLKCKKCDK